MKRVEIYHIYITDWQDPHKMGEFDIALQVARACGHRTEVEFTRASEIDPLSMVVGMQVYALVEDPTPAVVAPERQVITLEPPKSAPPNAHGGVKTKGLRGRYTPK